MSAPVRADDAIDEAIDTQIIEHLDFETPCSVRIQSALLLLGILVTSSPSRPCNLPAVSMLTCVVCGASGFCCGAHRSIIVADSNARCGKCEARGPGLTLYRFTPLGGA